MDKATRYFLVFIFLLYVCPIVAQQAKQQENVQKVAVEESQEIEEKGKDLISAIDSLSDTSFEFLQNSTDSLTHLSSKIEEKIQIRIDSLHKKLNEIKDKGNQQLSNVTERTEKLTRRIDSLQNLLANKLRLDKLNKNTDAIPGTDLTDKLQIPEIDSKSIPGLGKLKVPALKGNAESLLGDPATSAGISDIPGLRAGVSQIKGLNLTNRIDERIRGLSSKVGGIQQYSEMLKQVQHDGGMSQIDQIVDARAAQMAELKELGAQTKELEALKGLPEEMLADLKRYQDEQAMK